MKNKNNFLDFFEARSRTTEAVAGVAALAVLVYLLRSLLSGKTTLAHDNLAWNYPVFQFFAENIINGHFPFWNPFSHGGEPFYPLLGQLRLFEPTALFTIYIGHFFTNDIVVLFNWNRVFQTLIMSFGAYVCLRPFAINLFVRLTLIPILIFSSFFLGSFRQDAILNQFMWVPFIAHLFLNIAYRKDYRWHNWLFAAVLIGVNFQSYFFSGVFVFILFFVAAFAVVRCDIFKEVFRSEQFILKFLAAFFIISMMAAPNVVLMFEKNDYIFPARMTDASSGDVLGGPMQHEGSAALKKIEGINMPYSFIKATGTFSSTTDFVQMLSPDGNDHLKWTDMKGWGWSSEAYIYIGLLAWVIAVYGLVCAGHELKRLWAFIFGASALLMLGPQGGLHWVLYHVFPPMWFVRHTHAFVLLFTFSFLYFYVLGLNHLFLTWEGRMFKLSNFELKRKYFVVAVSIAAGVLIAFAFLKYYRPLEEYKPFVKQSAHAVSGWFYLFAIPAFFLLRRARVRFGEKLVFFALIGLNTVLVLGFSKNIKIFLLNFLLFLCVPAIIFFIIRKIAPPSQTKARVFLMVTLVAFLAGDLMSAFWKTSFFYAVNPNPGSVLKVVTSPMRAEFLDFRAPFMPSPDIEQYRQMRYLSLVYRVPDALSSVKEDDLNFLHKIYAKDTFFDAKKAGLMLPKSCGMEQGVKAQAERVDSFVALKIAPCSGDKPCYESRSCGVEAFAGRYVWFSAWVKGFLRPSDVAQIIINDGTKENVSQIYEKRGEWERLMVGKFISPDSKRLEASVYVSPGAKPVYFRDVIIETSPKRLDRVNMEYGLKNLRWSSFLLQASYFNLVNAGISPRVMEKIFAINGPLIQFKKGVIQLDDGLMPDYLKKLGDDGAIKLLAEKAFVDSVPLDNAGETFADSGPEFSYSVRQYDYDSIELKVSSPSNGFLYWADGYNKNWHAYVNGAEASVARANMNFKIIRLPKGESEVRFVYKPARFKYGLWLFYGALFAGGGIGLITYAAGRKEN